MSETAEQHVRNIINAWFAGFVGLGPGRRLSAGEVVGAANYLNEKFLIRIAELEAEIERLREMLFDELGEDGIAECEETSSDE